MSSRAPRPRKRPAQRMSKDAEAAMIAANGHLLRHDSTSLMGGTPQRLSGGDLWEVPIVLTSPGYGPVGEVGVITVDAHTGGVVGGTPKDEVRAAMQRLSEENRDALDAAFLRAKST